VHGFCTIWKPGCFQSFLCVEHSSDWETEHNLVTTLFFIIWIPRIPRKSINSTATIVNEDQPEYCPASSSSLSMDLQLFVVPWPIFSFLMLYRVSRTPCTADQPVASPLPSHRVSQTQNKHTNFDPSVWVGEAGSGLRQRSHCVRHVNLHTNKQTNKLHGLSPRANHTDRATAACRRSDCQLVRMKGVTWLAWRIPTAVFSVF
jgi:hypothetical protein